jgi:hypothetical protein
MAKAVKKDELVLIKWDSNWADEMDIDGFMIVDKTTSDKFKKQLKDYNSSFEVYVGTNEDIEYGSGEELLKELTFKTITEDEAKVIKKFFGNSGGHTEFWTALDYLDEWNDEDEDDEE